MINQARINAQRKYDKENTTQVILKLNIKTDADIIEMLNNVESKQGYIKDLVRSNLRTKNDVLPYDAIRILVLPVAKKNNLDRIVLFGSYARNEADSDSDIDLMIDGGNYKGLLEFMDIKEQFERALGKKVDLVSGISVNENKSPSGTLFKNNIIKDAKVLYEK